MATRRFKERFDSERNQGRAPDMGWLDHDRSGSTTACRTSRARSASRSSARLDGMLADARGWPPATVRRSPASEGLGLPRPDAGGNVAGGSSTSCRCPRRRDRDDVVEALRERGVQSKPYLPAIHLMTFYRERFGHREGEFPVCEDVAARSIALPFFPA
jgi:perosamine synthetase